MNRKLISSLFIALLISFFSGLFFPQIVQAYWTTPQYRTESSGSGTKYDGSGYNSHAYYYYQPGGGIYGYSWSNWGFSLMVPSRVVHEHNGFCSNC